MKFVEPTKLPKPPPASNNERMTKKNEGTPDISHTVKDHQNNIKRTGR